MKIKAILLLLISFGCNAATETNGKNDYIGSWQEHRGFGITKAVNSWLNEITNSLEISPKYTVTLKREFDGGKIQTYITKHDDIIFTNDFLIIPFSKNDKINYKLVISGWHSDHGALIFGTLYLYNDGQLFNGIPISFKPNKR